MSIRIDRNTGESSNRCPKCGSNLILGGNRYKDVTSAFKGGGIYRCTKCKYTTKKTKGTSSVTKAKTVHEKRIKRK